MKGETFVNIVNLMGYNPLRASDSCGQNAKSFFFFKTFPIFTPNLVVLTIKVERYNFEWLFAREFRKTAVNWEWNGFRLQLREVENDIKKTGTEINCNTLSKRKLNSIMMFLKTLFLKFDCYRQICQTISVKFEYPIVLKSF